MLYRFLLSLFILNIISFQKISATHIVGGEIQVKHTGQDYEYIISLNLYFDDIYGSPFAEDQSIPVSIFSKKTNQLITTYTLPKVNQEQVPYTNDACTSSFLKTRQIHYESVVVLDPESYKEEEGYYLVWERCCRNNQISNIIRPDMAGMVFYLDIPPIIRENKPFVNNSPAFSLPKGDYACVNQPFVFDFGATDGDELRYSLVTPLNGFTNSNDPMPKSLPGPYPFVNWEEGLSETNSIPGTVPAKVNATTGQISFTASYLGLYVIAVLCEEFRNGKKIGEVRRDFQFLVIDCPKYFPPVITLRNPNSNQEYTSNQIIELGGEEGECLSFKVTDSSKQDVISLELIAENFPKEWVFLQNFSQQINGPLDTLAFQLCFDKCADFPVNEPLRFKIVASDQSCPTPKYNTIEVVVRFKTIPHLPPSVNTDLDINQVLVTSGSSLTFNVTGKGHHVNTPIRLEAKGKDFVLQDAGMFFSTLEGFGSVSSVFSWTPDCRKLTSGQKFVIDFIVNSGVCSGIPDADTVTVEITYLQQPNTAPAISAQINESPIKVSPGDEIVIDLLTQDSDGHPVILWAEGEGFNMDEHGMVFETVSHQSSSVAGKFTWQPDCENTTRGLDKYPVRFIAKDNTCPPALHDTVTILLDLSEFYNDDFEMLPPNVFTPNVDDKNPYFMIPEDQLPLDNCINRFMNIEIYNRWGGRVFYNESKDFRWSGDGVASGVYYYVIRYSSRTVKGIVSLLR